MTTLQDFEDLNREEVRLETFEGWPLPFQSPEDLAKAGFYFLKREDKVQCAFCRIVIGDFEENDIPIVEHKKYCGSCPFVNGLPVGIRPIQT